MCSLCFYKKVGSSVAGGPEGVLSMMTLPPLPLEPPNLHRDTLRQKTGRCGVPLGRLVEAESLRVLPLSPLLRVQAGTPRLRHTDRAAWSWPQSARTRAELTSAVAAELLSVDTALCFCRARLPCADSRVFGWG